MTLALIPVSKDDITFKALQQEYEREFLPHTGYAVSHDGIIDPAQPIAHWHSEHEILLAMKEGGYPVGFVVINFSSMIPPYSTETKDIAEFYVIPSERGTKVGSEMASLAFRKYPGHWEVRQFPALLDSATLFWRKAINSCVYPDVYSEVSVSVGGEHWVVQQFNVLPSKEAYVVLGKDLSEAHGTEPKSPSLGGLF